MTTPSNQHLICLVCGKYYGRDESAALDFLEAVKRIALLEIDKLHCESCGRITNHAPLMESKTEAELLEEYREKDPAQIAPAGSTIRDKVDGITYVTDVEYLLRDREEIVAVIDEEDPTIWTRVFHYPIGTYVYFMAGGAPSIAVDGAEIYEVECKMSKVKAPRVRYILRAVGNPNGIHGHAHSDVAPTVEELLEKIKAKHDSGPLAKRQDEAG